MSNQLGSGVEERQGLDASSPWWTVHVARYRFARPHVRGRRVLDIACGTGYGIRELGDEAGRITGVDLDRSAVATASRFCADIAANGLVGDGTSLPFRDSSFDTILSFETIEHVENRSKFVGELARVLTPDGQLVLSTPNALISRPINGKPKNPFHLHEYEPDELLSELKMSFGSVALLGQHLDQRFVISPFWDEQEQLAEVGFRTRVRTWRMLSKLPRAIADPLSRALWHQPLYPDVQDYVFDGESCESSPVLVAICKRGNEP